MCTCICGSCGKTHFLDITFKLQWDISEKCLTGGKGKAFHVAWKYVGKFSVSTVGGATKLRSSRGLTGPFGVPTRTPCSLYPLAIF